MQYACDNLQLDLAHMAEKASGACADPPLLLLAPNLLALTS